MTFRKMMEAGRKRKEAIKEAVHQATLRYQREISNGGEKH